MKTNRFTIITMLSVLTLGVVTSCVKDNDDLYSKNGTIFIPVPGSESNGNAKSEEADNSWSSDPIAHGLEVPALQKGDGIYFIHHEARLSNEGSQRANNFSLEWDVNAYHSRWVAFTFNKDNNASRISRTNAWAEEPDLPQDARLAVTSYTGSGYTRGHICASADRLNSTEANQQTFYMSNMTPQLYDYNGGYWAVLEAIIQSWGRSTKYETVYVCKGGTILPNQLRGSFATYNAAGHRVSVSVPRYNFMAILARTTGGSYQAIGFWIEHKNYVDESNMNYSSDNRAPSSLMTNHAVSIDKLEELTGINFFCNLNDDVETAVESSFSLSAWNW